MAENIEAALIEAKRVKAMRLAAEVSASMNALRPEIPVNDPGIFKGTKFAEEIQNRFTPQELNQGFLRRRLAKESIKENLKDQAPAIGATAATFTPLAPAVAGPAAAARILPLGRQVLNIAQKFVGAPASGLSRAAAGGAAGKTLTLDSLEDTGEGKAPIDEVLDAAIEQGIADPIARLTLGASKLLLRPAGVLKEEVSRMLDFARREGLQLDPGTVSDAIIPKVVTAFSKQFLGSKDLAQKQLRSVAEHMSSDPANVNLFLRSAFEKSKGKDVVLSSAKEKAVEKLIRNSETSTEAGLVIDGDLLIRNIKEKRDQFVKEWGKEAVEQMENLAVFAKVHKGVPAFITEHPVFEPKSGVVNAIVGGTGLALDPTTVGIAAVSSSRLLASWIFNSRSTGSRWLTTGLVPKSALIRNTANQAASFELRDEIPNQIFEP